MSEDVATLADTVVPPSAEPSPTTASVDATSTEAAAAAPVESKPSAELTTDPTAQELGQILLDNGWSKDQLNDLLQAPKVLEQMRYQLQNDPAEFVKSVERADPKVGEKLLESVTDLYVDRYGDRGKPKGKEEDSGDQRKLDILQDRLNRLETERAQERQAAQLAATQQRYEGRVADLFGLKEVKDLGLTKSEANAMRARLDIELGKDSGAAQRIRNGNFVDVPRTFKSLIDEWASDKKAAAEAAKNAREKSESSSFPEFTSGPNPLTGLPSNTFDSWDNTEAALAKALERAK